MARIPDQVQTSPLRTPRFAPPATAVTDLGLGSVAQVLQGVGEAHEKTAQAQAQAAYGQVETGFSERFRPAAEVYDGREPGFAKAQIQGYDALASQARAGLSDAAAAAFDRLNQDGRVRAFDRSWQVEAQASGARVQKARQQAETAQAVTTVAAARAAYVQAREEAWRALDPSQPGAANAMLALYDAQRDKALAAAPEDLRPTLQLAFANDRADELLRLQGAEGKLREGWVTSQAARSIDALTNSVTTDPDEYAAAAKRLPQVLALLPPDLRTQIGPKAEEALATARFSALLGARKFDQVKAELDSGKWDHVLGADAKAQLLGRAQTELNSDNLRLLQQTGEGQLASEVASIAETGQSTGFDPASLAALGPAAVAAARQKVADAKLVFDATKGLAGLTPKDQAARLELLRPKPGDPDYARKKAAFDLGVERLSAAQALQQSDPAAAAQQVPEAAALWRAAANAPDDPRAAQTWAADTLRRQAAWGLQPAQQRVLPKAEAQRIAQLAAKAEPGSRAEALAGVYAYAQRFGSYGGQVLQEITRAGLDPVDAAVINITDADPVALGAYARGRERAPQVKLERGQGQAIDEQVRAKAGALARSFAQSGNGQVMADGLLQAITLAAKANVGDGDSVPDAVRKAAQPYLDRYVTTGDGRSVSDGGWRMPVNVAAKAVSVLAGPSDETFSLSRAPDPATLRRTQKPAVDAAMLGAYRLQRDLVSTEGVGLYARETGGNLTPAQKRAAYADVVADRGRWVTRADDGGLMLVVPDVRGGVTPVLDAKGKPVSRTWDELFKHAGQP